MITVLTDALPLQLEPTRHRGIGQYVSGLTRALLQAGDPNVTQILLTERQAPRIDGVAKGRKSHLKELPGDYPLRGFRADAWQRHLEPYAAYMEAQVTRSAADILHVHSAFEIGAPPHSRPRRVPLVLTVHDLIPLRFPEHYLRTTPSWYADRYAVYCELVRAADRIITHSECSRRDLAELLGVPSERVAVAAPGPSQVVLQRPDRGREERLRKRYGLRGGFVLCTAGFDFRKNLPGALRAYAQLSEPARREYPLVIVCSLSADDEADLRNMALGLRISTQIVLTKFLALADLAAMYRMASVQFFPSLYEGFGFPVLDAMALGVPVVCSHASSLPEVGGAAVLYADPREPAALAQQLARVLESPSLAAQMREQSLQQAARFNWSATAQAVTAAYREVAATGKP